MQPLPLPNAQFIDEASDALAQAPEAGSVHKVACMQVDV